MKVLSLFDWIACWYEALLRAWIKVDAYYASEIDKYAIQIAQKNHPDIIQVWDVCKIWYNTDELWGEWMLYRLEDDGGIYLIDRWPIDLVMWGSPCQWFSVAWKMLNFDDPRSKLFFEFVRIVREVKPKYFLLENVKMKKEWQDIISRELWVEPIEINSSLVSAQNRRRLYRTNIPNVSQPKDKWIMLKDILQEDVDEKYYYSQERWEKLLANKYEILKRLEDVESKCATIVTNWWGNHEKKIVVSHCPASREFDWQWFRDDKSPTLCARDYKDPKCAVEIEGGRLLIKQATKQWYIVANEWDGISLAYPNSTTRRWRVIKWKSATLTTHGDEWVYSKVIRKLTPIEYERLQTLEDNYTEGVSDSQRYKMLGNGRTVDVIAHIFSFMEEYIEKSIADDTAELLTERGLTP